MATSPVNKNLDFTIKTLGKCKYDSPLKLSTKYGDRIVNYVSEYERIIYYNELSHHVKFQNSENIPSLEKAGPRQKLFFDPRESRAAIVTCGGLAPGLNDVIRALVMELYWIYELKQIYGIRYGYSGFICKPEFEPIMLTPKIVSDIHSFGGTILGTSRGRQDEKLIVDFLVKNKISVLFCIGGDGTLRGAHAIYEEITRRKLKIGIVGIPKTIDNDIAYVQKTFGFETAFSKAAEAIKCAHSEALSAYRGIGLVKLMGRHSGYIAANAALGLKEVNFVLIPEVKFDLYGPKGVFEQLKLRLKKRKHAVIVIAEGAGQEYLIKENAELKYDASGNIKLGDIGRYLKEAIIDYFKKQQFEVTLKYIDPSYMIRSLPALPSDSIFCGSLAQNAVHCALAGKTDVIVGYIQNHFVHIPLPLAVSYRKEVDPESELWFNVLEATGQINNMINDNITNGKLIM